MKAVFVRPYVRTLRVFFRYFKLPLSRLVHVTQRKIAVTVPAFASVEEYAGWARDHLRWKNDPFGGAIDYFPHLGHLAWQLKRDGFVRDDCDGLAYFNAFNLARLADPSQVYVVTLVANPVRVSVQQAAHVICIFRTGGRWRVMSNNELFAGSWPSFGRALTGNPYSSDKQLEWVEVRDARLRPASMPRN